MKANASSQTTAMPGGMRGSRREQSLTSAGDVLAASGVQAALWIARHDVDSVNLTAGQRLWEYLGAELSPSYVEPVLSHLRHAHVDVRCAAAAALAAGMQVRDGKRLVVHIH